MSGPAQIAPVLARISEIQAQMGMASPTTAAVQLPPSDNGLGSFASALATASGPGGVVTSAAMPSAWSIPWAGGVAPVAPASTSAVSGTARAARSAVFGGAGSSGGDVVWPLQGTITQRFGPTTCTLEPSATINGHTYAHYHDGLDIGAAEGTPVKSMAAGTVEYAGAYPDGAVVVRVRQSDGSVALYAHLQQRVAVEAGDHVDAGETVGRVGMTGHTTGPHLHLELTVNGHNIDPLPVLQGGRLPGAAAVPAVAADPTASAVSGASVASGAFASSGAWTAASPLAADPARLSPAALDRFDSVAAKLPYHAEIRDAAVRAGIDPLFLASLVRAESGFRATAVSSAGAQGLCQLMPATAKGLGVTDPFDPVQNLRAGARYVANNLRIYGRSDLALAAYHDGKGAVAAAGGVPDYAVTHRYINTILSYWTHYREAAA